MGSRGQQRGHVTPERATLATRTLDACVIRCSKGKEGKLQPGRRSNGVGPGKLSAPTSSSARLRSCIWLVAFQATSCYAQVAIPMGSMMIRVQLTQA